MWRLYRSLLITALSVLHIHNNYSGSRISCRRIQHRSMERHLSNYPVLQKSQNMFLKNQPEKLVNGLSFQYSYKNWVKTLGKPKRVIPFKGETRTYWKVGKLWISLTMDSQSNKNTWFCIENDAKQNSLQK